MPPGLAVVGDLNGQAIWSGGSPQAVNDALLAEAKAAGYTVFAGGSADSAFNLYFLKPPNAFRATVMEGGVQGQRVGIMHVKATGTEPLDMDLPMANDKQIVFGDLDVGVDAPSDKCTGCSYGISLRVSAHDFKGPGAYDLPVIEFGALQVGTKNNYQLPTSCHIVVADDKTGTFDCKGLREQGSQAPEGVSGSWATPNAG